MNTAFVAGWSGESSVKGMPFVPVYVVVDGCKTAKGNEVGELKPWGP